MTAARARPSCGWLAVVTAAGHGSRFRPFSSVVPKEMLPLGSKPAVEHVIDECVRAGAGQVIVVTRPGDATVPTYAEALRQRGLPVETVTEDLSHGYGNAAPLLTLRERLAALPLFGVAFGDDVLLASGDVGADLATMHQIARTGVDAVVAAQVIDRADIGAFGVVDLVPGSRDRVAGIRQRPDPATVTEPLAVVSRLVLRPSILDLLEPSEAAGGEVDLGIAVGRLARVADVRVHRLRAHWITVGDPRRYFDALSRYWAAQDKAGNQPPAQLTLPGPAPSVAERRTHM